MAALLLPFCLLLLQADPPNEKPPDAHLIPTPLDMIQGESALGTAENEIIRLYRHLRPALVRVEYQLDRGPKDDFEGLPHQYFVSGVVVQESPRGCLVVAPGFHGESKAGVMITDFSGRTFEATEAAGEKTYGLSLFEVPGLRLEPPPFGFCQSLSVGSFLFVLGNGFGLDGSFSLGFLAGKDRRLGGATDLLQLTNSLNLGDGGGLVADRRGFLIGIAMTSLREAARLAPHGAVPQQRSAEMVRAEGVSFAVPIHQVLAIFSEHLHPAVPVMRPLLGVGVQLAAIDPALRRELGLPSQALVEVVQVSAGLPADQAGVQVGDYILGFGGLPVESLECLQQAMDLVPREGVLLLLRDRKIIEATVVWDPAHMASPAGRRSVEAMPQAEGTKSGSGKGNRRSDGD